MSDAIKNALRLAQQGRMPMHQAIARSGYATDGAVEGEVTTAPEYTPAPPEPVKQPDDRAHENVQAMLNENYRPSPLVDQMSGSTTEKALAANEIKPQPTAHEFVQQALNKQEPQLPQMDREAYERMKYGAPEVLHAAAYTNPVTAPAAAAYDVYQGAKSGNPLELGLAATGLPGRTAKAATMAAAAMMPQEAQADPFRFLRNREALDIARRAVQGISNVSPSNRLAITHSADVGRLDQTLDRWGALPSPSMAISRASGAPVDFGEGTLVGRPHLAVPSEENTIFRADAYTPRVPTIHTEGWRDKEARETASHLMSQYGEDAAGVAQRMHDRGELDQWARKAVLHNIQNPQEMSLKEYITMTPHGGPRSSQHKYAPTVENVVNAMHSGPIVGGESILSPDTGIAVQKALSEKPFGSIEELMASREKIASHEGEGANEWRSVRESQMPMGQKLLPYHVKAPDLIHPQNAMVSSSNAAEAFNRAMVDYFKNGPEALSEHYKDLPPEYLQGIDRYAELVRALRPTYYEAKPRRGVSFDEFGGALLPSTASGELIADKLVSAGLPQEGVHFYPRGAHEDVRRQMLLDKFGEHFFADGGEVEMSKNDKLDVIRRRGLNLTRHGYATDGGVEGDVKYAPEYPSLMDQAQSSIADRAMEERAKYDTGPKPGERTLQAGPEQSNWEKASSYMMGDRPTPERRHFVEGIGSAIDAAHMGAYAHPATRPIIGAVDFARGMSSGDPIEAAVGATGLPGGKMAQLAGAALASQAPSSAQAGPISDAMRLAKQYLKDKAKNIMQLPSLRELPAKEASKIAQKDIHLIPSGQRSEGYFIGGPRNVQSPEDLSRVRNEFDRFVAKDPRGGDWYDRYRTGLTEVTGGGAHSYSWAPKMQAQWSAGVSPEGELGFTLREMNAALAGNPVKSARPAQHKAFMKALEENDPNKLQLGNKTGLYATKINPEQGHETATSVNDFRHARNFQYTEPTGEPQRNALTDAQHKFIDYETAAAVGRANRRKVAGRENWTGEQLQAAPWVRQKAQDLVEQRPALTNRHVKELTAKYMADGMSRGAAEKIAKKEAPALAYEDAFRLANTTIADFFPKHTFNATYEQIPGVVTGHMPGAAGASQELREAFSADPRSSWALAPGDRSGIYGGLFNYTKAGEKTGPGMYVRPTIENQGMFKPEGGGATEFNPGNVDHPMIAFKSGKVKSIPDEDRALLEAGESTRAYVDAQEAGAGHINWLGGAPGQSNSLTIPMDKKATPEELERLKAAVEPHGYSDIVDTGNGLTLTNFMNEPGKLGAKQKKNLISAIHEAKPEGSQSPIFSKVDSVYQDYSNEWKQPIGSGAATRKLLADLNSNPTIREAFDKNEYIPQKALANLERDKDWQEHFGATREDIQNAREIIGKERDGLVA